MDILWLGVGLAFAFILGAAAGSFVGVCVHRIPRKLPMARPLPACQSCGAEFRGSALIPLIGYAIRRGRCPECGAGMPWRLPAAEFICGAIWAALFWRYGVSAVFAIYAVFFTILLAIFFIDIEWMRIPNILTLCAMVPAAASFMHHALSPLAIYRDPGALSPLLGLIPGAGLFAAVYAFARLFSGTDRSLGLGDVKLMFPVGLLLGFWQCLAAVAVASILGGVVAATLLLLKRKNRKDAIPFGPFIAIGAFVAAFLG